MCVCPSCQVSLLICFLCVRLARGWPSWAVFQFFEVVALWFFVAFLIFLIMHLVRLQARLPCINWPLTVSLCRATRALAGKQEVQPPAEPGRKLQFLVP